MTQPVDVSGLLELRRMQAPGKPDAVTRIVVRFLEESDQRLLSMREGLNARDPQTIERAAHAMKGIAGTVGAHEMADLAVRLELIGREGRTQGAEQLIAELEAAFGRARPIFHELVESTRTT